MGDRVVHGRRASSSGEGHRRRVRGRRTGTVHPGREGRFGPDDHGTPSARQQPAPPAGGATHRSPQLPAVRLPHDPVRPQRLDPVPDRNPPLPGPARTERAGRERQRGPVLAPRPQHAGARRSPGRLRPHGRGPRPRLGGDGEAGGPALLRPQRALLARAQRALGVFPVDGRPRQRALRREPPLLRDDVRRDPPPGRRRQRTVRPPTRDLEIPPERALPLRPTREGPRHGHDRPNADPRLPRDPTAPGVTRGAGLRGGPRRERSMPSEMLSGPDLGAGFLHQLTTDRDGDRSTFTYHAQEGGQDANGPPKGPLGVFGFVHPESACQFGGPRCWHRRFLLPFAETPKVRQCYNRNRFVLQTMIDQAYDGVPAAVETALADVVDRLAKSDGMGDGDWYVGGSTAAWLLGAAVAPHDIDLGTTRAGADRLGSVLADYLIEPVSTTDWPRSGIVRGARAFVGTFAAGARVEWGVPLEPGGEPPLAE